jgi:hypothetical protein
MRRGLEKSKVLLSFSKIGVSINGEWAVFGDFVSSTKRDPTICTQAHFMWHVCIIAVLGCAVLGVNSRLDADFVPSEFHTDFKVRFNVTTLEHKEGTFEILVRNDWAPLGAARFQALVEEGFFSGVRFFRVIPGFMAQVRR